MTPNIKMSLRRSACFVLGREFRILADLVAGVITVVIITTWESVAVDVFIC